MRHFSKQQAVLLFLHFIFVPLKCFTSESQSLPKNKQKKWPSEKCGKFRVPVLSLAIKLSSLMGCLASFGLVISSRESHSATAQLSY